MVKNTQPRYAQIADDLRAHIESGRYEIGGYLPTEHDLSDTYNVSRHTAREALRVLKEIGLVSRRQGSGTIVVANQSSSGFIQKLSNNEALPTQQSAAPYAFGQPVLETLSPDLAAFSNTSDTAQWWRLSGIQNLKNTNTPYGLTDIYFTADLIDTPPETQTGGPTHFRMMEQLVDKSVVRITQNIQPLHLDDRQALTLKQPKGTIALQILRAFLNDEGLIISVSNTIFAGEDAIHRSGFARI